MSEVPFGKFQQYGQTGRGNLIGGHGCLKAVPQRLPLGGIGAFRAAEMAASSDSYIARDFPPQVELSARSATWRRCAQLFWATISRAYRKHGQREFLISLAASDLEVHWAGRTRGRLDVE